MNKTKYVLGIDAGGTFFKSVLVAEDNSVVLDSAKKEPAGDDKTSVIDCYCRLIESAEKTACELGGELVGIGVSTPGPFDYENSISLMKHKLNGIYGVNIRETLRSKGVLGELKMVFMHDALSFLHGEYIIGTAMGYKNVAGITLGTGTGFAVIKNGELCKSADGGTAFSIWQEKLMDATVEDFLSRRGIISLYRKLSGDFSDIDVYDIEMLAVRNGNKSALKTFELTGEYLAKAVKSILRENEIECLILGGQISKGFPLMEKSIKSGLGDLPNLKLITKGQSIDYSAQIGASGLAFNKIR